MSTPALKQGRGPLVSYQSCDVAQFAFLALLDFLRRMNSLDVLELGGRDGSFCRGG